MDLATIEMEKPKAREAFLEYRRAVRERHNAEDEQIMRGYKALAAGHALIDLPRTIAAGGMSPFRLRRYSKTTLIEVPRIAVARAHAAECWTRGVTDVGAVVMQTKQEPHPNNSFDLIRLAPGTFPRDDERVWDEHWKPCVKAMVPLVPPPLRPKHGLHNYHVLWEAEWRQDPPPPPVDPALLRHVGGDLYAVIAIWDLSELERAVLAGRTS